MLSETRYEHIILNEAQVPLIAGTTMKVIELVLDHLAYRWSPEELHFPHPYRPWDKSTPRWPTIGIIRRSLTKILNDGFSLLINFSKQHHLPLTRPVYTHNYRRLSELNPLALDPVYDQEELDEPLRIRLRMEFVTTETEIHQVDIAAGPSPLAQDLLASITNKVIAFAKLPGGFAELYPIVKDYVTQRSFGRVIDLEEEENRSRLQSPLLQEGIAKYLARKIGELTAQKRAIEFENIGFKLSDTTPFTWRRNLPLLTCKKTIFNLVATYNDYEKAFARFLDRCLDIFRFASLGTTEQESGTRFRVDYLKPSGAIGFYHPDWVAVQDTEEGEVNWIIETKGRVWEDTLAKDAAISDWCKKVSDQTGTRWCYLRVNQAEFGDGNFWTFQDLMEAVR